MDHPSQAEIDRLNRRAATLAKSKLQISQALYEALENPETWDLKPKDTLILSCLAVLIEGQS